SIIFIAFIVTACGKLAQDNSYAQKQLVRLPKADVQALVDAQVEYEEDHFHDETWALLYMNASDVAKLPAAQEANAMVLDQQLWAMGGYDRDTFERKETESIAERREDYHDYTELTA